MPHGRTGQEDRDYITQRELLSQYLVEGASGRNAAGRPRGHDTRGYGDSDRGAPRTAGSRHNYPPNASGASRGHGGHHAAPGGGDYEDYPDLSDGDSVAGDFVDPRAGGARGSRGMGPYGSGNRGASPLDSLELVPRRSRVAGPPHTGTRSQQRGGTAGSRYIDIPFDGSTEESADDDDEESVYCLHGTRVFCPDAVQVAGVASAPHGAGSSQHQFMDDDDEGSVYCLHGNRVYCPDGVRRADGAPDGPRVPNGVRVGGVASAQHGAGSSRRHQELMPQSRRGGMYQGGRSGSVGSVDSEAELGGRNTSIRQYGRDDSGRDLARRRF